MRRIAVTLPVLVLTLACELPVSPGVSIGTFSVVGSLDQNGCGAAVPALDPIFFEVELRDDRGRGIWMMPEKPIQAGIRLPDGAYRFRSGSTVAVIAAAPGYAGCNLQQVEFVEVRIADIADAGGDAGAGAGADADAGMSADAGTSTAPDALEIAGLNEIQFTPTSTSDCSPLPVVNGGPWAALPCTVSYSLFGTGTGPEPPVAVGDTAVDM